MGDQDSIPSKGKILTENHALALRSMVLDNAFLDMQSLLDRAVNEDADLVYGLFTNAEGDTLALKLRGSEDRGPAKDAWKNLGFQQAELSVAKESTKRSQRVGQEVVEVAVPLFGEEKEALGTLRYSGPRGPAQVDPAPAACHRAARTSRCERQRICLPEPLRKVTPDAS